MRFAYLHTHTIFSIKDAIAKPEDYVKAIHKFNKSSQHEIVGLAITEHGCLYSMVRSYKACNKEYDGKKIKYIVGNEIYHVDNLQEASKTHYTERYHLPLLAKTQEGYNNLVKITTHSGLNKFKSKTKDIQVTHIDYVKAHGKGLIGLSGCIGGKIGKLILEGNYDEAKALAIDLNNSLDEFYLEIQPHDTLPEQVLVNDALLKINKETSIPLVITTDSHYVYKEDKKYHNIMKDMDNSNHFTTENHLWTVDELVDWCNNNNMPLDIIETAANIADKCIVDIKPSNPKDFMPNYPCPSGYNEDSYLIKLVNEGLKQRIVNNKEHKDNIKEYIKRINYEIYVVTQMGFSGYFLILWDWFKWCKENNILLGPGRGSAAGSMIAYLLDITKIDPIKNGLVFERFLTLERYEYP